MTVASAILVLQKKSMFVLFDFDLFEDDTTELLVICCCWLPLSAVVWLPLYFAWDVFGDGTANQNSIRAFLISLCAAVFLLVALVIWGFKKEGAFKKTGPAFFRTRTCFVNLFCFASPEQHIVLCISTPFCLAFQDDQVYNWKPHLPSSLGNLIAAVSSFAALIQ